jgi:hypothetical protein
MTCLNSISGSTCGGPGVGSGGGGVSRPNKRRHDGDPEINALPLVPTGVDFFAVDNTSINKSLFPRDHTDNLREAVLHALDHAGFVALVPTPELGQHLANLTAWLRVAKPCSPDQNPVHEEIKRMITTGREEQRKKRFRPDTDIPLSGICFRKTTVDGTATVTIVEYFNLF